MDELLALLEKDRRLQIITQRVGFSLWQLQELERVTATYLVILAQAQKGMGERAGIALLDKAMKRPFGYTLRQITEAELLDPDLQSRFKSLLKERNWLVHRSRADSRAAIHDEGEMQRLVTRVDAIAEESLILLKKVGELTEAYVKKHGVSEKEISEKAAQILKQWHTVAGD